MKLALVHPAFSAPGGAEILVGSHAQFFRDAGHDVTLLTFAHEPRDWAGWFDGIPVEVMGPGSGLRDLVRTQAQRGAAWARGRLAPGSTVVAYNYPASAIVGEEVAGVRRIWHCCEPPRDLYPFATHPTLAARARSTLGRGEEDAVRELAKLALAWTAGHAPGMALRRKARADRAAIAACPEIWALSEFSRDAVTAVYGRRDVEIVYPMVRFPPPGAHRGGLHIGGLAVLCHSRLTALKNVDTVLRGFAAFARTPAGKDATLHVVGEGPSRPWLETLARELGLSSAVTFHGYLSAAELERVYAACDVFALLSIDEPFGMVYPEAAARGLLVIGPDHGGPREILDQGRYGLAVDAFSPAALADALLAVTRLSTAEVDRRREEADLVFRERFSRAAIGRRLAELLARS